MPTTATASEQLFKAVAESVVKTFDFTAWLASSETLASVTSVAQSNTKEATELTIGAPAVNQAAVTVDGTTIAIGKAVQVLVSAGQNLIHYKLTATVISTAPQTFVLNGDLFVSND